MSFGMSFPGQGSQHVGMLTDLAEAYPLVRQCFDDASRVLGYDLWAICRDGPEETLNQTTHTQPAMLAAGVAVWRAWREAGGGEPARMAGHSLGEYAALVCAGALGFSDAVELVARRAELMAAAVPSGGGAMAAILGLDDDTVGRVCEEAAQGETVEPVNYNAPGQVVVAGHAGAVDRAVASARDSGAKRAVVLAVSVPSHCSLMRPAAEELEAALAETPLEPPRIPVVHNIDAASREDPGAIRDALARQLYSPVRWVDCVRAMAAGGARTLVEAGPGKVLTGFNKRIDRQLSSAAVYDPTTLDGALEQTRGG